MKYISKKITDEATEAVANCHAIDSLSVNFNSGYSYFEVGAYTSENALKKGKKPLSQTPFNVRGAPTREEDPYLWALNRVLAGEGTLDGDATAATYAEGVIKEVTAIE